MNLQRRKAQTRKKLVAQRKRCGRACKPAAEASVTFREKEGQQNERALTFEKKSGQAICRLPRRGAAERTKTNEPI